MKILCLIPARCGSKGINFKNIVELCGQPLLKYTTDIAINLFKKGLIDEVMVSTDCQEIADVSNNLGLPVPFLRPKNISGDKAKSTESVINALEYYSAKGKSFDCVLLLQPTSPLRSLADVEESIILFKKHDSDSLISVYPEETINPLIMYQKDGDFALPLDTNHNRGVRRQEHGTLYVRNGAIYITRVNYVKHSYSMVSKRPLMYLMDKSRSVNIDTQDDLELVRKMLCK